MNISGRRALKGSSLTTQLTSGMDSSADESNRPSASKLIQQDVGAERSACPLPVCLPSTSLGQVPSRLKTIVCISLPRGISHIFAEPSSLAETSSVPSSD